MFSAADVDGGGVLDASEFKRLLQVGYSLGLGLGLHEGKVRGHLTLLLWYCGSLTLLHRGTIARKACRGPRSRLSCILVT